MRRGIAFSALLLASCGTAPRAPEDISIPGYDELEEQVQQGKIGAASDHWIEMQNVAGEWERTGLIFGYLDDFDECKKAIAGLKEVNYAREYRCVPAN